MAVTRDITSLALLGTDETTGVAIANNSIGSGSEVDVLKSDAVAGDIVLYAVITSTVAVGSIDITINSQRVTGAGYDQGNVTISVSPINGTKKIKLGRFAATRYMSCYVKNNATGASATVAILGEVYKVS